MATMSEGVQRVEGILMQYLPSTITRAILESSAARAQVDLRDSRPQDMQRLAGELAKSLRLFVAPAARLDDCVGKIRRAMGDTLPAQTSFVVVPITVEEDILVARNIARDTCNEVGFASAMPTKIATIVSELARNIFQYAGSGRIDIRQLRDGRPGIEIVARDHGPGIANLDAILGGKYRSSRGMGMGLVATKRLMDSFEVQTGRTGTTITIRKYLV